MISLNPDKTDIGHLLYVKDILLQGAIEKVIQLKYIAYIYIFYEYLGNE